MNDQGGLTRETEITEAVGRALQANERTKRYAIEVTVQGATVSLRGEVDSQEDKEIAEQVARKVSGVVDVTNELVINPDHGLGWPLPSFGTARANTGDDVAPLGTTPRGTGSGSA